MWNLSSLTRDGSCVLYIGKCILNHWTTREVPLVWTSVVNFLFISQEYIPPMNGLREEKRWHYPIYCKKIQPVHPKGDHSWVFIGRTDAEAETPILWPPHAKSCLIGKDSDCWEEKGMTEDEMAGWHHWFDGCESDWTPGVDDGQGGLACCNSWGHKESDMTERLNWTELIHV